MRRFFFHTGPLIASLSLGALVVGCAKTSADRAAQAPKESVVEDQGITLRETVSPADPTVAQSVELSLTIESDQQRAITWPDVAAALADSFDLARERSIPATTTTAGKASVTRHYELHPIVAGETEIPSFEIAIADGPTLHTDPLTLTVRSVLTGDATTDLAPRKNVADQPRPLRFWLWIAGGIVAGLALVVALVTFLVRRSKRKDHSAPPKPPHEIALARLASLLASDLLNQRRFERFLDELSGILRHYIEDRFSIHAPQQTTEEFLPAARAAGALNHEQTAAVGRFLEKCDLVKFAKADADRADIDRAVDMVRAFIENSKSDDPAPSENSPPDPAAPGAIQPSAEAAA